MTPSPLHAGIDVRDYYLMHAMATVIPLAAGWMLFGWRAPVTVALVLASALLGMQIWKQIGWRGTQIETGRLVWMSLLLGLALPPHLLADAHPLLWPLVPVAGLMLVVVTWLLGGLGSGRLHPMLVTFLAIATVYHSDLIPHYILRPDCLVWGDLFDSRTIDPDAPHTDTWVSLRGKGLVAGKQAIYDPQPAAQRLILFTSGWQPPERSSVSMQMLLRDQLPPLEDLAIAGQPSAIGTGSAMAVIMGGLLLIYRGLIDYRIPLLAILAAAAAMLILPVPMVITDTAVQWRWLAFREHDLGWPAALTFVNYELLASPLLLVAFFLATSPVLRPITRRGRALFAILFGAGSAAAMLYASVSLGPFIALLAVGLITPVLDRVMGAHPWV